MDDYVRNYGDLPKGLVVRQDRGVGKDEVHVLGRAVSAEEDDFVAADAVGGGEDPVGVDDATGSDVFVFLEGYDALDGHNVGVLFAADVKKQQGCQKGFE